MTSLVEHFNGSSFLSIDENNIFDN